MKLRVGLLLLAASCAWGAPPWYSEQWAALRERMGPIDFDGRLWLSYPLGRVDLGGLSWRLSLDSTVDLDAYDAPSSRWVVSGLSAFLVPENRALLRAVLPGGQSLHFPRAGEGPRRDRGGNWSLEDQGGRETVRSPLGSRYIFERGQLVALATRLGRRWEVRCEAGHIVSIREEGAAGGAPEFACAYDAVGEPIRLSAGGAGHRLSWDGGLLRAWESAEGRTTFAYSARLVSRIERPGRPVLAIEWQPVPHWRRVSDIWWSPVRVARVDQLSFGYDLGHDGDVFTVTDAAGVRTVTRFNWFAQTVTQQVGREPPLLVRYDTGRVRPGYFISVRREGGPPLETYSYGKDRRLTRVAKRGPAGSEAVVTGDAVTEGWDGEAQPGMPIYDR